MSTCTMYIQLDISMGDRELTDMILHSEFNFYDII